ncbi:MAG: cyanoexosortase A system-associated protein [Pleurocapsa sp. MO_226.B13]|nr:cyanoexosortase A system-associated protein [Pleurocapsa sp. MO_226.B13]
MKNQPRTILLIATAIAVALTLGKSIIAPEVQSFQVADYTFPESLPLPQWKFSFSKPVNPNLVRSPASISGKFMAGKHYRYRQNERYLEIEMRYLVDTNGDLKSFITSQTGELSPGLRQDSEGGFYSLYADEDKAYLNACINPHGVSTVTSDQFNRNLTIHNTRIENILPWLLGQAEFRDKRCLWAHLSLPLDRDVSLDETYRRLETVWSDWYGWWRSHFPQARSSVSLSYSSFRDRATTS